MFQKKPIIIGANIMKNIIKSINNKTFKIVFECIESSPIGENFEFFNSNAINDNIEDNYIELP